MTDNTNIERTCNPYKLLGKSEYQTTLPHYNEYRGDSLYDILVNDKTYQVKVDEEGKPCQIQRYDPTYGMYVHIHFLVDHQDSQSDEVQQILQTQFINRFSGMQQGGLQK